MFARVLIANRGVIACRIIRTLRKLGVSPVAVYSEADRNAAHVMQADHAVCVGPAPPAQSYLNIDAILRAAEETGAEAVHPGYGFLSENPAFAQACEDAGLVFIGPKPEQMRTFSLKHTSRELAGMLRLPLLPGTPLLASEEEAQKAAAHIRFPVMLKSTAGGGGIGMRLCRDAAALHESFEAVQRLSRASFGNAAVFLEKAVERARHIEVQVFGDGNGKVIALGERDCSIQRRNQKVIEQTPAPGISEEVRQALCKAAVKLARAVEYRSAGTVEFLYDDRSEEFYFLEVNTRLQVEHAVTEEVTGVDLVEWMIRLAAGELPPLDSLDVTARGHSVQARIYAEDPYKDFAPSAGRLTEVAFPPGVRLETWIEAGAEISPHYDPMLAKLIATADTREEAVRKLTAALAATRISGVETNLRYLRQICEHRQFREATPTTSFLATCAYASQAIDVIEPGTQTTVQDHPGRLGLWHVGVPPSGPMDALSFRLANAIAGNAPTAAALEITVSGPTLRFRSPATIAIAGADFTAKLNGELVPRFEPIDTPAGATLSFGVAAQGGMRAYLAVRGGVDTPVYLGSKSTFILGRFGGPAGRSVRAGDVLHIGAETASDPQPAHPAATPAYERHWNIGVLYGPHGAPDYFTPADIDQFFATRWKVHHNSDRTGVRLIGPKPAWARKDGGEAGLHPSNIHDNAYAIGAVDFTGDMPVILGPDGPSLGGFVCPVTVVHAELWKTGQLRPGDTITFVPLTLAQAERLEAELEDAIHTLNTPLPSLPAPRREPPILLARPERRPGIVCRADGDKNLLIEYGPNVLDLDLRFRVHALEQSLRAADLPGMIDITPGIRSLQLHYDGAAMPREALLEAVDAADRSSRAAEHVTIPSRIVHLPLSWDDPATRLAIERYTQTVRPDAPWCPSNIEFIRRINGLDSIDDVYRTVFDASYLVLGLGDVYLGAPVATPVDPRHRLVTTKYNPARTWTPENAVGIGGAYLCVYGMEGPGGYQFVGRTVQMWNTWRQTTDFRTGKPWLLDFFDQIRFYPVSAQDLLALREDFPQGRFQLTIDHTEFSLPAYRQFLREIQPEASAFLANRQTAFEAERERWASAPATPEPDRLPLAVNGDAAPDGCLPVRAPVSANVHNLRAERGQRISAGDQLVILEAMKMEVIVVAPQDGVVEEFRCKPGASVESGQPLLYVRVNA